MANSKVKKTPAKNNKAAATPKLKLKTKPAAKVTKKPTPKAKAKPAPKAAAKPLPKAVAKPAVAAKPTVKPAIAKALHAHHLAKTKAAAAAAAAPVQASVAPVAAAKPAVQTPPATAKKIFKVGELVVYPAHGVGKISNIEEQEIAGTKLELYIVDFEKEKLRLKVPTNRAEQKGMRHLRSEEHTSELQSPTTLFPYTTLFRSQAPNLNSTSSISKKKNCASKFQPIAQNKKACAIWLTAL